MTACLIVFFSSLEPGTLASVHLSTFSNIISSETTRPIKVKFHIETPKDAVTKVFSKDLGHMTKLATMPIYGNNLFKNLLLQNQEPMTLELGILHWGMWGLPSLFKW